MQVSIMKFFCFFKKFLLDQGPFCGATDCPYFGLCVTLPMGFKARGGSLACTLICLHAVNLRVTSGATPAFSNNRGVHCIGGVYTTGPPSGHPSCQQRMAGNGGCSEIMNNEVFNCSLLTFQKITIFVALISFLNADL